MMLNRMWTSLSLALVLASIAVPAGAATHLGVCSLNGVMLQSDIEVGYDGVGSTIVADFDSDSRMTTLTPAIGSSTSVDANASKIPAMGDPKDIVQGVMKSAFEFGAPIGTVTLDTLDFLVSGDGSALNAENSAGNIADATVTATAFIEFFVDIVPPNDCDGFIQLQALRNLQAFETLLEINVFEDGASFLTLTPGSPGQVIFVAEDHLYRVQIDYQYKVPNGVDPPYSFTYTARVSSTQPAPVPTLGVNGAIGLGLLLLGAALLAFRMTRSEPA